jgi:CheY-like chemotaxis protein
MLAGSRVLVVEDEALIALSISAMLTDAEGLPVRPACSVREVCQFIKDAARPRSPICSGAA